jgi:hypothetical protein
VPAASTRLKLNLPTLPSTILPTTKDELLEAALASFTTHFKPKGVGVEPNTQKDAQGPTAAGQEAVDEERECWMGDTPPVRWVYTVPSGARSLLDTQVIQAPPYIISMSTPLIGTMYL